MSSEPPKEQKLRDDDARSVRELMIGVFLAPVAAAMHAQINYALVPIACRQGWPLLLNIAPLLALCAAAFGFRIAWRNRLQAATIDSSNRNPQALLQQRNRFLADFGVLFSGTALLLIVMTWLPVFLMDPCE